MIFNTSNCACAFTLMLFLLSGCGKPENLSDPIPLNTQDPAIQEELVRKLDSKSIEFRVVDKITILINKEDAPEVLAYVNQISNSIIPFDRSTAMAQPFRDIFIDLLKENKIDFEEEYAFNQHWIIWSEEDGDRVKKLMDKAISKVPDAR